MLLFKGERLELPLPCETLVESAPPRSNIPQLICLTLRRTRKKPARLTGAASSWPLAGLDGVFSAKKERDPWLVYPFPLIA
ncbi:hypothetical protein DFAR_630018 [Desulfarculales bacterium]